MYKGSSQTCYKLELRNRILKAAMTEFLHKGVKSVKMDDIANTLAISKRTLYEIYSNKEELLLEAVRHTRAGVQRPHAAIQLGQKP